MTKKTEVLDVVNDETCVHMTFLTPVRFVLNGESTSIIAVTGWLVAFDGIWYDVRPSTLFTTENMTVTPTPVTPGTARLLVRGSHLVSMVPVEKQ